MQPPAPATPGIYTALDFALLAVILLSTLLAWRKGFIRVLFSLAGLAAGVIAASWYYRELAWELHRFLTDPHLAALLSFLVIAAFVILAFAIAGGIVRKAIHSVGLGIVDNLLGAAVGFVRGVLLCVVAIMAIAVFFPNEPWVKKSQLSPYFLTEATGLSFVVPDDFRQQLVDGARILLHETPELFRPHTLQQHVEP